MSETDESEARAHERDTPGHAPISHTPKTHWPRGIRRFDPDGKEIIDAMAGRASVFGFGFDPITEAIQSAAEGYLGDASGFDGEHTSDDGLLKTALMKLLGDASSIPADAIFLCPAADMAVETAIGLARRFRGDASFRTVAMLGSDHGRTGMCRTASGRPELHQGFGPMMAGFTHVPVGDLDAVRSVVDEQTACILLSPVDLADAARPCDADYLSGLRAICDERDILLIIDETQLVFGSSGRPFAYAALADIQADVVVLAGGVFGGLAGGIVLATERITGQVIVDAGRYPLLAAVASETFTSMSKLALPQSANDSMRDFAVALAGQLTGFEFIRDVNVLGMTIGIETDIESRVMVRAAHRQGLRIESAGDLALRIQPPLVISDQDQQTLLARLGETMEEIERTTATAELGVDTETE